MAGRRRQFFRKVLALEPDRIEALVNLANLLRAEGQFEAAARLAGAGPGAQSRKPGTASHLGLGLARSRRQRTGRSTSIAPPWRASPDYAPALANLADLLADDGDFEAARTLYDRAIKADPAMPRPGSTAPFCIS